MELPYGLSPYENDPGAWGASLLNNAEILLGCLEAAEAGSIVEIGAYAGDLTRLLLLWAAEHDATVLAVDPSPQPELEALAAEHPELTLVRELSLTALDHLETTAAVIVDGDHNHYTVTQELTKIEARALADGGPLPLLLIHDVSWPHARRDDYFDPEQIPAEQRRPVAPEGGLYPGVDGIREGGLPYHWPAAREGGPGNGVLTAVEDFVTERPDLRLIVVPSFFGLGVVFHRQAPYAGRLQALLGPYEGNPLLERLERNRVLHLASSHVQLSMAREAQERLQRIEALLQRMLGSRAFAAAELFLRVRQRGKPAFSRDEIRRLIDHG